MIPFPFNSLQVEPEKNQPKHVKDSPSQVFLEFHESVFFGQRAGVIVVGEFWVPTKWPPTRYKRIGKQLKIAFIIW